jgi:4a-hydroxytetrahydrobiopterin dehydratase
MEKLSQEDIAARLETCPEWAQSGESLTRTYGFDDFREAIAFVGRIADLAEEHQHHPDIMIRYNKVTLTLSTHDAGGLTEKDFALAVETDAIGLSA